MSPPIPVPPLLKGISTNPVESVPLGSMSVGDIQKLLDKRLVSLNSEWKDMGYKKHVPGVLTLHKRNHARWLSIVKKIHQWIYSWMKPGYVEDEFEYQISKILLMQFISSAPVLVAAEGKLFIILRILKWLRGYVYTYEGLYLLYLRKRTRTFYTAHSSAHEVRFISYF